MLNFYMLIGAPCSGKTTWIKEQQWDEPVVVLSTDDVVESVAKELDKTYTDVFKDVIDKAQGYINSQLYLFGYVGNSSIMLDQTNLTKKSRAKKLALIPKGYKKVAVVFHTPIETLMKRLEERNETGKVLSRKLVQDMFDSMEMPDKAEGFDEILPVYYLKDISNA